MGLVQDKENIILRLAAFIMSRYADKAFFYTKGRWQSLASTSLTDSIAEGD
jgi:hypothetical protein